MKRKRQLNNALSMLCIAGVLSTLLAGCGGAKQAAATPSGGTASGNSAAQPAEPVKFNIVLPYSGETPTPNSPVEKELKKQTNSDFTVEWTPMISYGDKYNVMMNSGQLPDALVVPDLKADVYLDAAHNDQFWELSDYLTDANYDGFKNYNSIALQNCKTDGKLYVLPRERTLKRQMVCYRSDWAKKAGLDAPDTLDKLYAMAKAFSEGDFDGNGKKDTVGFALGTVQDGGGSTIDNLNELIVANGGVNKFGLVDGKIVSTITTPEYKSTIQLLRKMCSEGLISKDFPITKTTEINSNLVDKEKTGLWLSMGIPGPKDTVYLAKKKSDSNVKQLSDVFQFTYLKDKDGTPRSPAESGFNGGIAFPKSSTKDKAELDRIVKVFSWISAKDGQRLVNSGIEGLQYNKVDETHIKSIPKEEQKDGGANWSSIAQMSTCGNYCYTTVDDPLVEELAKQRNTYKDNELIGDITVPLNSAEYAKSGAKLSKLIDTAMFKYILGQVSDDEFDKAIQEWRTSGGDKMTQEYTEDYQKSQQK